jgi:hypothetical protein
MKNINHWLFITFVLAILSFWACDRGDDGHHFEEPADVEDAGESGFSRVTFTEKAMERIGVQTTTVIEESSSPTKKVVPYGALLYGPEGQTWIYTCPEPRVFLRQVVDVDRIEGNLVYLNEGPPVETVVAIVGVAEIYGTEFEIGH